MSIEPNTTVETVQEDNLDDFATELFSKGETKESEPEVEIIEDVTEEVSPEEEEDTLAPEEPVTEEPEEPEEESPPKKKNSFQERITELNAKYREQERQAQEERRQRLELEARVNELIAAKQKNETNGTVPAAETTVTSKTPDPKAVNEDGTNKYPLGEFDPAFLSDLVEHKFEIKQQELIQKQQEEQHTKSVTAEREQLTASWNEKIVDAQERYPDFQDKGQELVDTFEGIDDTYGQYLTDVIMSFDNGTDVLYHLASNPEQAKQIVDSGARKATIALAKLDAQFVKEEKTPTPAGNKVSNAPPPPPKNKGSSVARTSIKPDTDNLDDFERLLFKG